MGPFKFYHVSFAILQIKVVRDRNYSWEFELQFEDLFFHLCAILSISCVLAFTLIFNDGHACKWSKVNEVMIPVHLFIYACASLLTNTC